MAPNLILKDGRKYCAVCRESVYITHNGAVQHLATESCNCRDTVAFAAEMADVVPLRTDICECVKPDGRLVGSYFWCVRCGRRWRSTGNNAWHPA